MAKVTFKKIEIQNLGPYRDRQVLDFEVAFKKTDNPNPRIKWKWKNDIIELFANCTLWRQSDWSR